MFLFQEHIISIFLIKRHIRSNFHITFYLQSMKSFLNKEISLTASRPIGSSKPGKQCAWLQKEKTL